MMYDNRMDRQQQQPPRVAILGAGAMGSIFGAELASHGVDTLLVDVSTELVDHLNREGIALSHAGAARRVPVPATTSPDGEPPADAVIVFVKCWATDDALSLAGSLIGDETLVLSLQNGLGNGERIAQRVDPMRVLVGVTYHSGTVAGLGEVEHTGANPSVAATLAAQLSAAGLATEATDDVVGRVWRKVLLNVAANPVAALTGLHSGALVEEPHIAALMEALTYEAVAVARADGQPFERAEAVSSVRDALRAAGPALASMRQDVVAGRRTEIDVITGAVIAMADRHGLDVPLNRAIFGLIKGYEAARHGAAVPT